MSSSLLQAPPLFFTCASDLPPTPFLSFSDENLDSLFSGRGLPLRGIVELSGEAGSGKTALSMVIALRYAATYGRVSLIVNTEGPYPAARLEALTDAVSGGDRARSSELIDLVRISDVRDAPALEAFLEALPRAVAAARIGLVVIDSIAAPLRADLGSAGDAPERARWLIAVAAALLRLNAEAGVAVIIVNQVTDMIDAEGGALEMAAAEGVRYIPRRAAAWSGGRWARPALGPAWDSCVAHRIMLTHPRAGTTSARRGLCLMRSPIAPAAALTFELGAGGLEHTVPPVLITD
jgi:KaiC/GvpD/RAD55 family RecA-like ATPase